MDAYGIFQGGGAKGYAHVGALKAAELRGIHFTRIAGSSAGAIIATLAAAGYSADDLLDPTSPPGERGLLDVAVRDVLDAAEYARVERAMRRYHRFSARPEQTGGPIGWWRRVSRQRGPLVMARFLARLALPEAGLAMRVYRQLGAVGTEPVERWLDELLRKRTGTAGSVTFGDLEMRLRMVAADVTTGAMHRFGFPGDERRPVAPAAVASACFPFFFRPVRDGRMTLIDGGLISNLPVWLFDDERDDDTSHLPTFGFRLVSDALVALPAEPPTHFLRYAQRMAQTLLSGNRHLEERRVDYYHGIDLAADVGTLSFDEARAAAPELVESARRSVEEYFEREVAPQDPDGVRRVLLATVNLLAEHNDWTGERVRAHVLLPDPDGRHATTVYGCNMEDDADDHLRVRTDVEGVGAAFRLREPVYVSMVDRRAAGSGALKYELAVRPSDVRGLYAVPMFHDVAEWAKEDPAERAPPFGALVIDRRIDFAPLALDGRRQDEFANVAAIVGEAIRNRAVTREAVDAPSHARTGGWDEALSTTRLRVAARKVRDARDRGVGERLVLALRKAQEAGGVGSAHVA